MRAVIITIGDELLIGQVLNSNAAWLGEQLNLIGIDVVRTAVVGDDLEEIRKVLADALADADIVITTGGLGPTHDDLTREALAESFGVDLRIDEGVFDAVRERFSSRGRRMPESNRRQAMVPEGFAILPNAAGTAPGLWHVDETGRMLIVLPGVPHEMKGLFTTQVQPLVLGRSDLRVIEHRTLRTAGIGESTLQEKIGDLDDVLPEAVRLAFLPGTAGVRLRLTAFGETRDDVHQALEETERALRERIAQYIYSSSDESLEEVVGRMLLDRDLTIAVAESCTGGHVVHQITNVSGSSAYLIGGVVAYSNQVKTQMLGVDEHVLASNGAVSRQVAEQMAAGVRRRLQADIGVSTTGIAGPTGGSPDKPVGTVWIGYSDKQGTESKLLRLAHERLLNKELTTTLLLEYVRRNLLSGRPNR